MNIAIPLATSIVSFVFALTVLDQYLERRRSYQLVWTVGLKLYAFASLLQTLWLWGVDGGVVFRLWYFAGAMLVAAYLGMGTVYLLVPRRIGHGIFAGLVVLTVVAGLLALGVRLQADVALLEGKTLASIVPGTESERFYPGYVGALTAFLNAAGSLALVGGAVYSAIVFARRRAPGYRVVSNVLIAAGAFISAAGGTLERFDLPEPHSLALLLGVIVIYIGFLRSREVFALYRVPFWHRPRQARS